MKSSTGPSQLITVIYDVSSSCNYRCIYCRNDWEDTNNMGYPQIDDIRSIIGKIAAANVKRIIFTGGEFFLMQYWKDVLTFARKMGLSSWVITNASLIHPEDIPFLEKCVERINVSFHTADKMLYRQIMGTEDDYPFDAVIRNLRLITDSKMALGIFFSPLRVNYRSLFDTIKFLVDHGIRINDINLNRIIPTQHSLEYFKEERPLNYAEHRSLIEQLVRIDKDLNIEAFAEAYPACFLKEVIDDESLIRRINKPCFLGRKVIAINGDGTLKLCPATGFSISATIEDLGSEFEQNRLINEFRDGHWRNPACRKCSLWDICFGGCHASSGELFSNDILMQGAD